MASVGRWDAIAKSLAIGNRADGPYALELVRETGGSVETVSDDEIRDRIRRGLDTSQGALCVIDGAKALRKAIRDVLGQGMVQRCQRHKERNVLEHLPERDRAVVKRRLRQAWEPADHATALGRLRDLASGLDRTHPGAAASLREGMEETLTLTQLGVRRAAARDPLLDQPCESMISVVRTTQRNVKRWRDGEMALRWTAAGMLEAERQFRRVIGYRDLGKLAVAVEREVADVPLPVDASHVVPSGAPRAALTAVGDRGRRVFVSCCSARATAVAPRSAPRRSRRRSRRPTPASSTG
jgi:putative transposase